MAELEEILASAEVVEPEGEPGKSVVFGATVMLSEAEGTVETRTIVGVDELSFEPDAVSWISAFGRALLAAKVGDRVTLEDGRTARIVKVEYRETK